MPFLPHPKDGERIQRKKRRRSRVTEESSDCSVTESERFLPLSPIPGVNLLSTYSWRSPIFSLRTSFFFFVEEEKEVRRQRCVRERINKGENFRKSLFVLSCLNGFRKSIFYLRWFFQRKKALFFFLKRIRKAQSHTLTSMMGTTSALRRSNELQSSALNADE